MSNNKYEKQRGRLGVADR